MIIENSIAHEIYHIRIILLKYQKNKYNNE